MRNQLFPALLSVLALVSNPASSDNFKLPVDAGNAQAVEAAVMRALAMARL